MIILFGAACESDSHLAGYYHWLLKEGNVFVIDLVALLCSVKAFVKLNICGL